MQMNIHGGNIRQAIERFGLHSDDVIDFSASINPLGMPRDTQKKILGNFKHIFRYPDIECKHLKESLCEYIGVPPKNLLIGNGSIELIFLIMFAIRPARVLIPIPTFSEYEKAAGLVNAQCVFVKSNEAKGFAVDVKELVGHIDSVDMIFLCNPNNPTSFLFNEEDLLLIADQCQKKRVFCVVDEVFMDFVKNKDSLTLFKTAHAKEHLIVLGSLTKFFSIAGLRLGYMAANSPLVEKISQFQPPWSVNTLAQAAGLQLLRDERFIDISREFMFKERDFLFKELSKVKFLKPYPPSANFIFCRINNPKIISTILYEYCANRGIIIRDCSNFRGLDNRFIRVAVCSRVDNKKLIDVLRDV